MDMIIIFGVPAVIAFVLMFHKLSLMKTAVNQDTAYSNIKSGGVDISVKNDTFLYSRVTKTLRPKSKN